ncbi:MAG: RIP metalloprotease [Deltaproteobacteria bacterium]|nr:RIP metalloprotease [Deltaproteobacteria bacterium]
MIYFCVFVVICLIILVHEGGHLLAARLTSLPVKTVSIGFGPRLAGFSRRGVDYRLSLIPLGGYIEPAVSTEEEFYAIGLGRRVIFTLGGVAANIVFAVGILFIHQMLSAETPAASAFLTACRNTLSFIALIASTIPALFTTSGELAGIIGVARQGGSFIAGNFEHIFTFAGLLSLNLAVINLLPLPVLDGGKALFYALEKIVPQLRSVSAGLSMAGWIVIMGLTILATSNDIAKFAA